MNINSDFIETISPEWTGAVPASFFYGPDGNLLERWEGARSYQEYEETVKKLLEKE